MTPEDKLKQAAEKIAKKWDIYYHSSGDHDPDVLLAMEDFATSEAAREYWSSDTIEFAMWLNDYCTSDGDNTWRYYEKAGLLFTTEQLYQEFLKQK